MNRKESDTTDHFLLKQPYFTVHSRLSSSSLSIRLTRMASRLSVELLVPISWKKYSIKMLRISCVAVSKLMASMACAALLSDQWRSGNSWTVRKRVWRHVNDLRIAFIHHGLVIQALPFVYWSLQIRKVIDASCFRLKRPTQGHLWCLSLDLHQSGGLLLALGCLGNLCSLHGLLVGIEDAVIVRSSSLFWLLVHDWLFMLAFVIIVPVTLLCALDSDYRAFRVNQTVLLFLHHLTLWMHLLLEWFLHLRTRVASDQIWISEGIHSWRILGIREWRKSQASRIWIRFFELIFAEALTQIILWVDWSVLLDWSCGQETLVGFIHLPLIRYVADVLIRLHFEVIVQAALLEHRLFVAYITEISGWLGLLVYF